MQNLLQYLHSSPTAWNAVDATVNRLSAGGYSELKECADHWNLIAGGRYYVIRNGSSIIAFVVSAKKPASAVLLGAHTDSPGFKLKPNAEIKNENWLLLSTQLYGATIQPAWFNRNLGLAGRCYYLNNNGEAETLHINISDPVAVIPDLSIHLNRDLGTKADLNSQIEMNAIAAANIDGGDKSYIAEMIKKKYGVTPLPGSELFLVPLDPPTLLGHTQEMIASPRLDNLLGCDAAIQALLASSYPSENAIKMIALWDHEEVGSESAQGAGSTFLMSILNRIAFIMGLNCGEKEALLRRSFFVSNDVVHGYHPNYPDKCDKNHRPLFGKGVVIKCNANQRYATDAATEAKLYLCFKRAGVEISQFVVRSDMGCGSTIGNVVASRTGIPTVDVGVPILSMHSPVELGSAKDQLKMIKGLKALLDEA